MVINNDASRYELLKWIDDAPRSMRPGNVSTCLDASLESMWSMTEQNHRLGFGCGEHPAGTQGDERHCGSKVHVRLLSRNVSDVRPSDCWQ